MKATISLSKWVANQRPGQLTISLDALENNTQLTDVNRILAHSPGMATMTLCHEDITSHRQSYVLSISRGLVRKFVSVRIKQGRILPRYSKSERLMFLWVRVESLIHVYVTLGDTEPSAFGDMIAVR